MRHGVLCLILLLARTAIAWADAPAATTARQELCLKDEQCRKHYAAAKELSKAGKFLDAIREYEAAYAEIQIPVFLYNMGRLNHRLGRINDAAGFYRRFLGAAVDDDQEQQAVARDFLKEIETLPAPPKARPADLELVKPPPVVKPPPAVKPQTADAGEQPKKPVYKRWWLWVVVGAVVAGGATGLGVALGTRSASIEPNTEGLFIIRLTP